MKNNSESSVGTCAECEQPFRNCCCDPCQHDKKRNEGCVFCERKAQEIEHAI
jgi:hypothetical protein